MIPVLSDRATCMCPHGGRLQFMVTHRMADGADGQVLTLPDYTSAMIVGCALPPVAGGPCMKVAFAQDPLGRAMTVRGQQVVTNTVIAFSDKGWPILVVHPGMSGVSIMYTPSVRLQRRAEFALASVKMRQVGASENGVQASVRGSGAGESVANGSGSAPTSGGGPGSIPQGHNMPQPGSGYGPRSQTPWKDAITAYWGSQYLRRGKVSLLRGHTIGFADGTSAALLIYHYDADGDHTFVTRLSGSVAQNRVEAEWTFEYERDVNDLPDMVDGAESYEHPVYFFELKVGGKTARSGLIEFVDTIHVVLDEETAAEMADLDYIVYFADGTSRRGRFEDGEASLVDIPPGRVHWHFLPREKWIDSVAWDSEFARRGEPARMIGRTFGFDDGTPATFTVYRHATEQVGAQKNASGDDVPLAIFASEVIGGRVTAAWNFEFEGDVGDLPDVARDDGRAYEIPTYYLDLNVGSESKRSNLIEFRDWIEVEIVDKRTGEPLTRWSFTALLADGTTRVATTDARGVLRLIDIPPGRVHIRPRKQSRWLPEVKPSPYAM